MLHTRCELQSRPFLAVISSVGIHVGIRLNVQESSGRAQQVSTYLNSVHDASQSFSVVFETPNIIEPHLPLGQIQQVIPTWALHPAAHTEPARLRVLAACLVGRNHKGNNLLARRTNFPFLGGGTEAAKYLHLCKGRGGAGRGAEGASCGTRQGGAERGCEHFGGGCRLNGR